MPEIWIFLLSMVWLAALLRLLFSKGLPVVWKIAAVLLFGFTVFVYQAPIWKEAGAFRDNPGAKSVHLLLVLFDGLPWIFLVLWPLELWRLFRLPAPFAEKRFRFLFLFTVFYWLFWFTAKGMDQDPRALVQEGLSALREFQLPEPPLE